jgi:hypothetical protein
MVPLTGIEPVRFIQPRDFKSLASANSATAARMENCFLILVYSIHIVKGKAIF